jgi:hypothetical protein
VDEQSARVLDLAERFADGEAVAEEMAAAHRAASQILNDFLDAQEAARVAAWDEGMVLDGQPLPADCLPDYCRLVVTRPSAVEAADEFLSCGPLFAPEEEAETRADLVRCILGNPFRPVSVDPSWPTPNAMRVARGIYEERAFDRLPILGEVLRASGCANAEVLAHCQSTAAHARGCWVVDLILNLRW